MPFQFRRSRERTFRSNFSSQNSNCVFGQLSPAFHLSPGLKDESILEPVVHQKIQAVNQSVHRWTRLLGLTLAVSGLAAGLTPSALAQKATTKATQPTLEQRLQKAITMYNTAVKVANAGPVYQLSGTIEDGDTRELTIDGTSVPVNGSAERAVGLNYDDRYLTIYKADPNGIGGGRYSGYCVPLSQTEFTPAPAIYFEARKMIDKYGPIIQSLRAEIQAKKNAQAQSIRDREKARLAKIEVQRQAQRDSVYRARLTLADKETKVKLSQLDQGVAAANDKGAAYRQSSQLALTQFNKWGALGVPQRVLIERSFDDLANAAAWYVSQGDWKSARSGVERLLSLQVFQLNPKDAKTGRERLELGTDDSPSGIVATVMLKRGKETLAATNLAREWLGGLPEFIAGPAPQNDKVRVTELTQLLGTNVFAPSNARTAVIASAVDTVRGAYGPGSLVVLDAYKNAVADAKRVRVARETEQFRQTRTDDLGQLPHRTQPDTPRSDTSSGPRAEQTNQSVAPVAALKPEMDFNLREVNTMKRVRLSDFKDKTVILYFYSDLDEVTSQVPTPVQRLFAISQRYDPNKVIFILVNTNSVPLYAAKSYRDLLNKGIRDGAEYPKNAYILDEGRPKGAGDVPPERAVAKNALLFYAGNENPAKIANRVTVINAEGNVVGSTDFEEDFVATGAVKIKPGEGYRILDFKEEALEDLLVKALGPQK